MFRFRRPSITKKKKASKKEHEDSSNRKDVAKIVFLYAPVGWQRVNMGLALYENESVFRRIIDDIAVDINPELPMDLRDVLFKSDALGLGDLIHDTHFTQPALFAVEAALDALWRSRGIHPDAVLGHSIGEFAAACSGNGGLPLLDYNATFTQSIPEVTDEFEEEDHAHRNRAITKMRQRRNFSGPLTRKEAARCVLARSTLMAEISSTGYMMAVRESAQICEKAIRITKEKNTDKVIDIGAINTPTSTVISGEYSAISLVLAELEKTHASKAKNATKKKSKAKKVRTTHPDHSMLMSSMATGLESRAENIFKAVDEQLSSYDIDANLELETNHDNLLFYSTVTGELCQHSELRSGNYWSRHATGTVNFVQAFQQILSDVNPYIFIEIGESMLLGFAHETIEFEYGINPTDYKWTPSLAAKNGDDAIVFSGGLKDVNLWLSCDTAVKNDPPESDPTTRGAVPRSPTLSPKFVHCKFQPPPHILNQDPSVEQTVVADSTFIMTMPVDAPCRHFIAFVELQYGMKVDIFDALDIVDSKCEDFKPIEEEEDLNNALALAAKKELKAAYFVVRSAGLDENDLPLPPRFSSKKSSSTDNKKMTPKLSPYNAEVGRRILTKYSHEEYDPYLSDIGRLSEADIAAKRQLLSSLPKASTLSESNFPSDAMGGRCLDKWGYRWGQRSRDLWLYLALPNQIKADDITVNFNTKTLDIIINGITLHGGPLWNVDASCGIDPDTAAWVIVDDDNIKVLQIEMYKNKPGWWKAVWEDHPKIEPWEIPYWKNNTFNDGYHRLTKST